MLRILLRGVERCLREHSPGCGSTARFGAIAFIHRFGSSLNEHVHFHCCIVDGVFQPSANIAVAGVDLAGAATFEVVATNQLNDEYGRPPTNEEIAKFLGLPKKKLSIIKKAIRVYNSTPQSDQADSGWSIDEMLEDGRAKSPDAEMMESDVLKQVLGLLDKMDKREANVLRMRFGLDCEEPKTLKEIGECLGLTRERVRQIESEALSKLNESLSAD